MKNPKYDTSLYNHRMISDGSKPLISNAEYMELYNRVKLGDRAYYDECCIKYFIEPKQDKRLLDILNGNII